MAKKRHTHTHTLKIKQHASLGLTSGSLPARRRYEQSEWGWKEREKRDEMKDERAWYLLARDSDSAPVAFSHFRFDVECGEEVLYW